MFNLRRHTKMVHNNEIINIAENVSLDAENVSLFVLIKNLDINRNIFYINIDNYII